MQLGSWSSLVNSCETFSISKRPVSHRCFLLILVFHFILAILITSWPFINIFDCNHRSFTLTFQYKAEESLVEATKSLKGTELAPGRKLFFEIQGPNGEIKSQETAGMNVLIHLFKFFVLPS